MSTGEGATAVERAAVWLGAYLAGRGDTAPASEVIAAGLAAGHSERGLRRAGKAIGVETTRSGFGGGGTWTLADRRGQRPGQGEAAPKVEPAEVESSTPPDTDAAATRALRVPVTTDGYGRPTAFVQVSDPAAASQWDERVWHRIG